MSTYAESSDALKFIELDWFADDDTVRVTPRNQQRFDIQKDRAIEILQQEKFADQFKQQFGLLLDRIGEWIFAQKAYISRALLTTQDGQLALIIVQSGVRYDEDFQDKVADLDYDIANDPDLSLIHLKSLALPKVQDQALRSFVDERLVLSFPHGERKRGPRLGGAAAL